MQKNGLWILNYLFSNSLTAVGIATEIGEQEIEADCKTAVYDLVSCGNKS